MSRLSRGFRPRLAPSPLARAARLAALCAAAALSAPLAVPAAHAQAAAAATRAYAIAPGPLAQVLAQYAAQAGVTLAVDAAPLGALRSGGLQGEYTVEAGFARLLDGSGLRAVRDAGGGYALQGTARSGVATLPSIKVSAAATANPTTEGVRSFAAPSVSLFKGVQSVRGIPQPVTVMTRELLDERALPDLHEVLNNTPGVTVDYTDSERVNYFARGHQIDSLQIDGLSMNHSGSIFVQPDTAVLDRIEVLRGAAGMLRGSGNPSATVNLVRKRPTADFRGSAALTLGSWDRRRLEGDVSGPLNAAGTLRGRVVAVVDDKAFFQKSRTEDRKVLYGVVEADIGPRTTVTASLQHTDLNATGAWGNLPSNLDGTPLGLPRDTYLGADWNRWNRYNQQAFAELLHRFDNDWSVKLSAAHTRLRMKSTADGGFKQSYFTRASTTDPYLFDVSTSIYSGDASDQNAVALVASGPFELLGRRHELTVGAETQRVSTIGTKGFFNVSPITGVDIRTWDPYTSYPEPFASPTNGTAYAAGPGVVGQKGVYATSRLSVTDPLSVLLGARLSWWKTDAYAIDRELTPYLGLVYDVSDTFSVYASYTDVFTPQNVKGADDRILDPIRGKDYEAGVKGEFFGGRLNASFSLFRIDNVGKAVEDTSSPSPCPNAPTVAAHCRIAGGKTRSQGWETELAGEVMPGWHVMGGYTNTRTRYIRDSNAGNVGLPLRSNDPRHLLRLFTTYELGGALQGWTVGGGAQVQSDSYVTAGGLTVRHGGYAIYNAMLGYRFNDAWSVQLNVNNLSDKVYYKKYTTTGISNYYGDPRNALLTLRARF